LKPSKKQGLKREEQAELQKGQKLTEAKKKKKKKNTPKRKPKKGKSKMTFHIAHDCVKWVGRTVSSFYELEKSQTKKKKNTEGKE